MFFFFYASLVCQACLRASQTQFLTSDSQASRKILVLCILYEDKLILHSLDLICCVSNNFLALFGDNLLPHRPPLFSVQFPDNIHTAGDQNNTDKTWFQSTLTGLLLVAKNTGFSVFIGIFRSVYWYSVKFNTDSVYTNGALYHVLLYMDLSVRLRRSRPQKQKFASDKAIKKRLPSSMDEFSLKPKILVKTYIFSTGWFSATSCQHTQ